LDVTVEREEAARLGLRVKDVHEALQAAVGGVEAGQVVEGRERYGVQVRYARDFRAEPAQLERVLVQTPTGELVPLGRVAKVASVQGPDMLRSEDGALVSYVFVDLDEGVPVASYVEQARAAVERDVALPQGVRLSWVGQYEAYERAGKRLATLVPLTLLLVALLLYLNTRSWIETVVVMLAVPFSAIGAVWLMYLLGYPMSVASWVGMIALAGLDAETGVVMLLYLTMAWGQWVKEGRLKTQDDLREAIVEGAARRIRPKLMTMLTTLIGLMPLMWSDGTGADVMRRMAAPMLGGLATSFALELLVYPALFAIWKGWGLKAAPQKR
jgi:Cu(I)/Ag(I) efflux system membrane protein CusA/SilA